MKICDDCKHNCNNKYCKFFQCHIVAMYKQTNHCLGYKRKTNKTSDTKKKSIKQEKKLAKDIGAKRTPQSGAQDTSPSDMIKGNYIIESKATKGKSISVREEWLNTLKYSPMHLGKIPTLIIEFLNRGRYVIMAEEDFKRLTEKDNE